MKIYLLPLLLAAILLFCGCGGSSPETPTPSPTPTPLVAPPGTPPIVIELGKQYTAIIETEKGNITVELFASDVPITVNNFVFLATERFYDNTTFHRVIPGYIAQGGDPSGTGYGWPGYKLPDEFSEHTHVDGALSMANAGQKDTNGCQFFIAYGPQHQLDGKHSVFGLVIDGMAVVENLTPRDPSETPDFEGDAVIRVIILES